MENNKFVEAMENVNFTENGGLGYKTTMKPLVDCNFFVSSWRDDSENDIWEQWKKAYDSNPENAITWLFYLRDCREGLGERRSFRIILKKFADEDPNTVSALVPLIAEYGRWDDLLCLLDTLVSSEVLGCIYKQLKTDWENLNDITVNAGPVSLLAKWLPSENASSKETKRLAKKVREGLHLTAKEYRKTLSELREYINVTERFMCANEWDQIDYNKVPSKANMIYSDAFMVHDNDRRWEYEKSIIEGSNKGKVSGVNPYEILKKYTREDNSDYWEALWNQLLIDGFPGTADIPNTVSVIDTSGSMLSSVAGSTTAMDIAISLGLYFASITNGPFKDRMITFSRNPEWINVSNCNSLKEKLDTIRHAEWGFDTNIKSVFDMILAISLDAGLKQEDIPENLMIVSDMEFNSCINEAGNLTPVFKEITAQYHKAGYKVPRLIFWNVASRTKAIPTIDVGDNGIVFISGFSQNSAKTAITGAIDPEGALIDVLLSPRYTPVRNALYELSRR